MRYYISTLLLLSAGALQAQFSGAIYTSLGDGSSVNANLYPNKPAVYLNGGPQNASAAGLPLGTYYFEVWDPSGSTLLSTDPAVCRQVVVAASGVSGKGVIFGVPTPPNGCYHAEGTVNPTNGSKPVQLIPFNDTPNNGGEYKVRLIRNDASVGCSPTVAADPLYLENISGGCTKSDNFKVEGQQGGGGNDPTTYTISGTKFYDANADGVFQDGTEVRISGWQILVTINGQLPANTTYTGGDPIGWAQTNLPNGTTYVACEVLPPNSTYLQTSPVPNGTTVNANRCWTGTVNGANVTGLNFGNLCLGAGGGMTLGFWSNRNGQALFDASDLAALVALNLRTAAGAHFDPSDYAAFRTWILSASATNMANMLSAQLAAMKLNTLNGKVSGSSLIYAPNTGGTSDFKTVDEVMGLANTSLGTSGLTLSGHPDRAYQEALKNALDRANNNLNFVQSSPCAFSY